MRHEADLLDTTELFLTFVEKTCPRSEIIEGFLYGIVELDGAGTTVQIVEPCSKGATSAH